MTRRIPPSSEGNTAKLQRDYTALHAMLVRVARSRKVPGYIRDSIERVLMAAEPLAVPRTGEG